MTSSTHRHTKYGDGRILSWFEAGMVMFQSNHGRDMLREESLTPIAASACESPERDLPPELPSITPEESLQQVKAGLEAALTATVPPQPEPQSKGSRKKGKAAASKIDLNTVSDSSEIAAAFPQMGRVGAKKLFDKKPVQGWVSVPSIREFAGDLFPSEDSWQAFVKIFQVG